MVENGQLRTVIDSQFSLEDSQAAYDRSRSGRASGEIVINIKQAINRQDLHQAGIFP